MIYKVAKDYKGLVKDQKFEIKYEKITHCEELCPACKGMIEKHCIKKLEKLSIIEPIGFDEVIPGEISIFVQHSKPTLEEHERLMDVTAKYLWNIATA